MQLYSTNNRNIKATLKEAAMQSLAPDRGLYMPESIGKLPEGFVEGLQNRSLAETGYEISRLLTGDEIPAADLREIVSKAIDFPAPIVFLDDNRASLELWHGPSLAFKDFGDKTLEWVLYDLVLGWKR